MTEVVRERENCMNPTRVKTYSRVVSVERKNVKNPSDDGYLMPVDP